MLSRRARLAGFGVVIIAVVIIALFMLSQAMRISLNVPLDRSSGQVAYLQYDPNIQGGANVYLLDVESGTVTQLTTNRRARSVQWTANGESLVLGISDTQRLEMLGNGQTQPLPDSEDHVLIFSPDKTHFAYDNCPYDTGTYGWQESAEIVVGETNTTNTRIIKNACFPAWSSNGEQIAFTSQQSGDADPEIYIQSLDGSEQHRLTINPGADVFPIWSSAANQIAFQNVVSEERVRHETLYRVDQDGQNLIRLDDSYNTNPIAWSPDGQTLLYVNLFGKMCFLKADATTPDCPMDEVVDATWSPDGTQVAYTQRSGLICITDPLAAVTAETRCFPETEIAQFLMWRPGP